MLRVLIVDDDANFRALCARLLRRDPGQVYEICQAPDPEAAISVFSNDSFDCVLVDYRLPGMSGTDLIRTLQQESEPLVPMILLSAEDREDTAADACLAGAADYLPKCKAGNYGLAQAIRGAVEQTPPNRSRGVKPTHQARITDNAG